MQTGSITINGNVTVNSTITFNELVERLGEVEKAAETPTSKKLRENAGDPIMETADGRIRAYSNGYAVYENDCGRTVLWIPDCESYTYRFQNKPSEDMGMTDTIGADVFGEAPWFLAIMINGDHRVEDNMMNRSGSRKGTREEDENENGSREDSVKAKIARMMNVSEFGNPEEILIRKETVEEKLGRMTERQREVFLLYHKEGYTQQEIADMLGITQKAVDFRLDAAERKMKL